MANTLQKMLGSESGLQRLKDYFGYKLVDENGIESKTLWVPIKQVSNPDFNVEEHIMKPLNAWLSYAQSQNQ